MFSACLFPHPTPVYSSQSVMCVGTRGFCSVHEGNFAILPCKEAAKRKDLNIRYQNRVQFFNCHKLLTPVLCLCQVNVDSGIYSICYVRFCGPSLMTKCLHTFSVCCVMAWHWSSVVPANSPEFLIVKSFLSNHPCNSKKRSY